MCAPDFQESLDTLSDVTVISLQLIMINVCSWFSGEPGHTFWCHSNFLATDNDNVFTWFSGEPGHTRGWDCPSLTGEPGSTAGPEISAKTEPMTRSFTTTVHLIMDSCSWQTWEKIGTCYKNNNKRIESDHLSRNLSHNWNDDMDKHTHHYLELVLVIGQKCSEVYHVFHIIYLYIILYKD